jgi:hypothetical protein
MTTAPLEITKATGIGPLAGGFSGLRPTADFTRLSPLEGCSAPASRAAATDSGTAAAKPTAPDASSNSLRVKFPFFISTFLPFCVLRQRSNYSFRSATIRSMDAARLPDYFSPADLRL